MAFNAGSIEATLTLNRNPFTAGLQAARQQAEKFAREKFEVNITPKLNQTALRAVKEQIERTAGNVSVTPRLDRGALTTVKAQIERTVGRIQVRTQLDRTSLATVKGQIDRTIGRIQVRAQLERSSLQAIRERVNNTVGRIQARVTLDRDSIAAVRERIANIRATINARLRLDQESVTAVRKRINETIRPRLNARLSLDRSSIMEVRARIAAMSPIIRAQLRVDSGGAQQFTRTFARMRDEVDRTGNTIRRFGNDSERVFRHMDGTVRTVFMALPLLLPAAASAITGVIGGLGGIVSILGVAGAGLAAWGGVAISVFGKVSEGAALSRTEIAKLPAGIREASGALKTLQETWDALVARTQTGVGYAMAAGFDAATAAVRTLDPVINAMSETLAGIGRDMQQYFGTEHWSTFVNFIASNVGPVFNSLWEIVKNLTRGVMDLVIAFMPLGQWLLDSIASGMQTFAQWASELAGNPEFANWLQLVKDSLSSVADFLGTVIVFLFNLSTALAPVGNVILDTLTMIFDGLNKLSPEMLAGITMGFAGLFAALLMGAGGPIALVVGGVLGLAAAFLTAYENSAPFREAVDSITAGFRDGFLPIAQQVQQAYETQIKPAFDGMASAMRDNVMPVLRDLGAAFGENVMPAIGTLVEIISSKLVPAFFQFMEAVAPVVAFLVDVVGQEIIGTFEVIARTVGGGLQAVAGIFQAFAGLFTGNWTLFWDGLKNVGEGILRGIVGAFGFSLEEFQGMLAGWGATISGVWNSIWTGVGNFFRTVWDGIVNFITVTIPGAWNSLITGAGNAVSAVGDWFASLPEMIGYALGYAIGTVIKWGIDIYNAIVSAWAATMAWFAELPAKIQAFFVNAGAWLVTTGVDLLNGLQNGINNGWAAVIAWFVALPGNIAAFFTNALNWLTTNGVSILLGMLTGILEGWNAVVAWFNALPGNIMAFFVNAAAWLLQVGRDILNGLISGLAAGWTMVTTWIRDFTRGFIQGVKDALGIASPSTIFAGIGGDILRGLIQGAQAMWGAVVSFFSGLWNGLLDIARNILAGIVAVVTGAFNGVQQVFQTFSNILQTGWNLLWNTVRAVASSVWGAIQILWNGFTSAVMAIYNAFAALFQGNWQGFWNGIRAAAQIVWNAIQAAWNLLTTTITNIYNVWSAYLTNAWNTFWNAIWTTAQNIWNYIQAAWDYFVAYVRSVYDAWASYISNAWNSFWTGIWEFAQEIWDRITNVFQTAMDMARDIINRGADEIGRIWRKVANFFREPINWVIDVVINRGILGGWNTVMGWIGAESLQVAPLGLLPMFAEGGEVPMTRGAVANKDSVLAGLMPGEYVFSKRAIENLGGLSAVDQLHRSARLGVPTTSPLANRSEGLTAQYLMNVVPSMDDIIPYFAYGGVQPHVAAAGDAVVRALGPMPGGIGGVGQRANASDHPVGLALDFMTLGNVGLGNRVADFLTQGWGQWAVKYLIWQQRIANSPGAWTGMENRGSPTANHMDHVHASFLGEGGAGGGGGGMTVSLWSIFGSMVEGLFNNLLNFAGMPGAGSLIGDAITEVPRAMVGHVINALREMLENMFTTIFGGGGGAGVDVSGISGPVVDQVRQVAAQFGWSEGAEWDAIMQIVQKESSWNPNAANPNSSARGLFQKMTSIHGPVEPTPAGQAAWGLNYIRGRYGTPTSALGFHNANGYYDEGGWLMPGPNVFTGSTMMNKTHKPEAVLTDEQWTGLLTGLNAITGGQVFRDHRSGDIVIHGIERLGNLMMEIRDLLERRGAAANIIVEDKSGSPVETARAARLALRLS